MNSPQDDMVRMMLWQKREEILRNSRQEIQKLASAEHRDSLGAGRAEGDFSVSCSHEHISLSHCNHGLKMIRQIENALIKLRDGTYGRCEDCGEAIARERLAIIPFADLCIDCQEHREASNRKAQSAGRRDSLLAYPLRTQPSVGPRPNHSRRTQDRSQRRVKC